jgi:hypothetical protein
VNERHPSREDLTAYALGALESDEDRAIAEHADGCETCSAELRYLAPAVGVLAESVDQQPPPAELRERVMAVVREEAESEAPAASRARSRRSFNWSGFLMRPATALATVAVIAAGVGGYLAANGDDPAPADTFACTSPLPDAGCSVVVEDGAATMHVHGMPALPDGSVYKVWVSSGGAAKPSATFVPHDDGTATAAVPEAASDVDAVLVTRERRPGTRTPTFPPVLDAQLG